MTTQQTVRPQMLTRAARDVFKGVLEAATPLPAYDRPWNEFSLRTPRAKPDYVWDPLQLKTIIAFFVAGGTSMKAIGETGTGKTEAVVQFHAALNLPLFHVTANPRMEAYHLIGRLVPVGDKWEWRPRSDAAAPTAGCALVSVPCTSSQPPGPPSDQGEWIRVPGQGMEWRDGPVAAAARWGVSCLVDEYNVLDPGEATGLNAFLEGRDYTIPDTGETLRPAPGFRCFATVNPKSPGYSGRQTQDLANDDRFSVNMLFQYPSEDVEKQMVVDFLMSKLGQKAPLAGEVANVVVKAANKIREAFMGENDGADALPFTMSRRGVMEWAKWTVVSHSLVAKGENPLFHALDLVLGNRQDRTDREALRHIVEIVTGQTATTGA